MIYAIRCGSDGPIKLGYTRDIKKRLTQLQISHHEPLFVLATEDTGDDDELIERWIHELYSSDRIRGEWFKPSEAILCLVERMKIGQAAKDICRQEAQQVVDSYNEYKRKSALWRLYKLLKAWIAKHEENKARARRVTLAEYLRLKEAQNGGT